MGKRRGRSVPVKRHLKPSEEQGNVTSVFKLLTVSAVVGLAVVFTFPEIGTFFNTYVKVFYGSNHTPSAEVPISTKPTSNDTLTPEIPPEVKNFKPTYQKNLSAKKIFFEGRRISPVELLPQNNISSNSVRVYLFDDFLSAEECDGLRAVHDKHIKLWSDQPPILCFESIDTLKQNLRQVGKSHINVRSTDFTKGSYCLNTTFSDQVANWMHHNWSHSTAFYPGETVFSKKMAALIHETTALRRENGGKFQITSYPLNVGYKEHTDCTVNGDKRDRMATVLVYLDDVVSGGETSFSELGIWVKPKKGRALVWNNMDADGDCAQVSSHQANKVTEGRKYIIQRWYYYESFWSLGKRPPPPSLPARTSGQARVSCDEFKHGSCRWYDEWSHDILEEYRSRTAVLV